MQPGDVFDYNGAAERVDGSEQLRIEGRFKAIEQRDVDGAVKWLVEDVRLGEFGADVEPDTHRYLIPDSTALDSAGTDPATAQLRDAFDAGAAFAIGGLGPDRAAAVAPDAAALDDGFTAWQGGNRPAG